MIEIKKKCCMFFLMVCLFQAYAAWQVVPRVPIPDSSRELDYVIPLDDNTVICIDSGASDPVMFGAERLQKSILRLSGITCRIVSDLVPETGTAIVLKEKETSSELDGFQIQCSDKQVTILGDNARSVIYGQDTFLSMVYKEEDGTCFIQAAEISDKARLKLRSFAQNTCAAYASHVLDAYVDARLNCIELRDGPPETMNGQFGYPVNWKEIPREPAEKVLRDAHKRGIYVYGVVSCGVADDDADIVLSHFRTLAELGVDGLYISYDDPGNKGDAVALVKRILEFAKEAGYDHENLAFLPPAPDYGLVATEFNKKMLAEIPELAEIRWYFTAAPSDAQQHFIDKLALHHPRGWWFNWPMGNGVAVLPMYWFDWSYICVPDFSDSDLAGAHPPEVMKRAADKLDSAMVWVRSYPEYLGQLFGTWAWNPERFDGQDAKMRIYSRLYGAPIANKVRMFDEVLVELKGQMTRIGQFNWNQCVWHMAWFANKAWCNQAIQDLYVWQKEIAEQAPKNSIVDAERLEKGYLKPMGIAVEWIDNLVNTEFPERIHPNFDRDLKWEREHGTEKIYLEHWKKEFEPLLDIIEERFGKSAYAKDYVERWRKKLTLEEK